MRKSLIIIIAIISSVSLTVRAQSEEDTKAITACLQNYISGEGDRVELAFHPSASMKFITPAGEFKDVPIHVYIAGVKANKNKTERKSEITSITVQGAAAQAQIRFETDKFILYDFMNLLKIDGNWKIVGKIFSRKDK